MNKWLVRSVFAAGLLAQGQVAFGQSAAVVDLKDFRPREVKSAVFTVASSQDLRIEAVGAESDNNRGTFSWVTTMWNGKQRRSAATRGWGTPGSSTSRAAASCGS